MKPYFNIILITATFVFAFSCKYLDEFEKGNGEIVTERRSITDFKKLKIGGNFEVFLKNGDDNYVQIITDENLLSFIDTEVKGGVLVITQQKKLISRKKIKLIINYVDLNDVRVMGAVLLKNDGYLEAEDLEIRMDGAGIIELKIKSRKLKAVLSGAGIVKLAGEVHELELNLTGAGKLEAFDLESQECDISVGGLGGAEIFVTEKLDARIEGIGGIEYAGDPGDVTTEINGLGRIKQAKMDW
jgi:hypothetical protein